MKASLSVSLSFRPDAPKMHSRAQERKREKESGDAAAEGPIAVPPSAVRIRSRSGEGGGKGCLKTEESVSVEE